MKHPKKAFVSALLAVAMVITCFLSFGGTSAAAVSPELEIGSNTIYYFTDLYPTLHEDVLFTEFGSNYNIVYDHQGVTKDYFTYMVNSGYFTGFDASCVVIIDIKTFLPDDTALRDLFGDLDCKSVFVTSYSGYISPCGADLIFYDTALERFGKFIEKSLDDYGPLENTYYLIDNTWGEVLAFYNGSVNNLDLEMICNAYPPLRVFIEKLTEDFGDVDGLIDAGIKVLVYTGNGGYIDILTGNECSTAEIVNAVVSSADTAPEACAFGVWAFQTDYYNNLLAIQHNYPLPVYAMLVDPLEYDEDGLVIITDEELEVSNIDEAGIELLAALRQLLNS